MKILKFLAAVALVSAVTGCSKKNDPAVTGSTGTTGTTGSTGTTGGTSTLKDVFVAGSYNVVNGFPAAILWKNGVTIPLTDGKNISEALSVFVVGTDIYVAGYDSNVHNEPRVWKNGNALPLVTGFGGQATSVYVLASLIVYSAGFENNGAGTNQAKFWVNNTGIVLTDGTHDAKANAVFAQ